MQCGVRTPEPGTRVPEVHLPGHGAGPSRLHRSDAGDLLGDSRQSDQFHRRRDAGLQQPLHPLRPRVRRAANRDRPGGRGAGRDDFLAGRPVRGAAADRAPAGVPPALLPEGQRPGHRGAHYRHAGRRDHPHRSAVRVHPARLARLLDLRRDGHAGIPDHVRADVHRRDEAAPFATGSSARVPSPGAGPAMHPRRRLVRGRARDRVHPSVAVRPLAPPRLRRPDPGRDSRRRYCSAAADGPTPQTPDLI